MANPSGWLSDPRPGSACTIIAEVSQSHDGSLGMAHAFIDAAATAGADAIKFQTHIAKVEIREDVRPDHIELQTQGIDGILINVSWTLHYHVRAPKTAIVRVRSSNGAVDVSGFSGRVIATSTNGGLTVSGLAGGAELRSTNGDVHLNVARIGADLIEVRSTNGQVHAMLPADANANLLASATNGRVQVDSLSIEPLGEQTPRRVRGRLGSGGTPIEITATNGNITVTGAK